MPLDDGPGSPARQTGVIMWDMAGTLIPFDQTAGRSCALPGCDDFLPELARDFRHVVTTGDGTGSARSALASFEILPHIEAVYGDLATPHGKPYGEILRELGGDPGASLAVGDRLGADIATDTDRVVTMLVNQNGDIVNAGMISYMIHVLRRQKATDFPTAFRHLTINAVPDTGSVGAAAGGAITAAWRRNDGFDYRLWQYEHPALGGERQVIVIAAD